MVDIDLDSVLITLAFIVPIVIVGFIGYNFYLQDSEPPDLVNYVIFNNEDNNTLLEPNERKTILLDLSINSDYWHMNLPYPESEVYLDVYGELL